MQNALWWRDFVFEKGVVTVKKTGARLRLGPALIAEVWSWLVFYAVIETWRLRTAFRRGPRIWFTPDRPRPWYLVWPVLHAAGARIARSPAEADSIFFFDDVTDSAPPDMRADTQRLNFDCESISKSHVAAVFEEVFGYPLSVDPAAWTGPMVEKSEQNAAHDGRILHGPCEARPGRAYQRVIDNRLDETLVEDIRCPTLAGEIPLVFLKRREIDNRFANANREVLLARPEDHFSEDELGRLAEFTRRMKLDWGSLDVLRDRADGRLYVVDVNKTDMGPPTALPFKSKLRAVRILAAAFRRFLHRPSPSGAVSTAASDEYS